MDKYSQKSVTKIVDKLHESGLVTNVLGAKILLVGSNGFLGQFFKEVCIEINRRSYGAPVSVIAMDNFLVGGESVIRNEDPDIIEIKHDITEPTTWLDYEKFDFIINCSGCASPASYGKYPLETMAVSTVGTEKLLKVARKFGSRILNFSSSEVLSEPDIIPTPETQIPKIHSMNPRSCYDVTKLYIETLSWVMREKYGVNAVVVRPFNVVGPGMRQNDYRVFPSFTSSILSNSQINVFSPGLQTRSFVWITDFILGCFQVLLKGTSPLYHLGNSDNHISMIDLAHKFENICGTSGLTQLVPTNDLYKYEPQKRCPSVELAKSEVGFNPTINLDSMIKMFYDFAVENYTYDAKTVSEGVVLQEN